MKEARENISFAAFFAVIVTGPAALIAGIVLIAVAHSEALSSVVFFGIFAANLFGIFWWPKRRISKQKCLTVHEFVAHVMMHPELLPRSASEIDLERFRRLYSGSGQAGLKVWIRQFREATRAARPSSKLR